MIASGQQRENGSHDWKKKKKGLDPKLHTKTLWSSLEDSGRLDKNKRTVGMMGTITGLVRTSRVLYAVVVICVVLGRIGLMECKVVEDDVWIERREAASVDEECEQGELDSEERRERDEEKFSLIRGNDGFLNQLAARCVLTRSSWRACRVIWEIGPFGLRSFDC